MLIALLLAAAVSAALTWPVRCLAFRIGAVAHPGGRHIHQKTTPTAGGLAIFAGFWVAVLAVQGLPSGPLWGMLVGSVVLLVICLVDDIRNLSPLPRLAGQFAVALIAYQCGVRIEGLTNPISWLDGYHYLPLGLWGAPVTVLWIVMVTNAINWLDGLDGLVAGVAAMAALTIMLGSYVAGTPLVGLMAAALGGACLGFLPFNFNPARIFMGDTGAMFLGFMLACIAVIGPIKGPTAVTLLVPLLVLGVPLLDTVTAIVRRLSQGKSPFAADRGHFHHRLIDRGLTVRQAVLTIYVITALLCWLALEVWHL